MREALAHLGTIVVPLSLAYNLSTGNTEITIPPQAQEGFSQFEVGCRTGDEGLLRESESGLYETAPGLIFDCYEATVSIRNAPSARAFGRSGNQNSIYQ